MRVKIGCIGCFVAIVLVCISTFCLTEILAADQALIDAAKKEGKLTWYTAMTTDSATGILTAFSKKYPFLDTGEFYRSGSLTVYNRINIESSAGKYIADVTSTTVHVAYPEWKNKGWLMQYNSPEYAAYADNIKDSGYWAPHKLTCMIMAYNTKLLPANEIPKRWADLTDPKWQGQLGVEGIDSGSQYVQYYILKKVLGPGYWKEIAKNKPKEYDGVGQMMNALLRGEIKIGMMQYDLGVYQYKVLQKAPIEGIFPAEGVPISLLPIGIMKNAPHPNAAKLFLDWSLSGEGQKAMLEFVGSYSARKGMESPKGLPPFAEWKQLYVENLAEFAEGMKTFADDWSPIIK